MKAKPKNLMEYVLITMSDGTWWTDWDLQRAINKRGGFYSESSINAQRRALRDSENRKRYGLPTTGEIVIKRPLNIDQYGRRGYEYKLLRSNDE